jgi:hypothetical protein
MFHDPARPMQRLWREADRAARRARLWVEVYRFCHGLGQVTLAAALGLAAAFFVIQLVRVIAGGLAS